MTTTKQQEPYPLGIDIASYQGESYNTTGLSFVFSKATEGTGYVNPRHAGQIATGRQHALIVGHYHFVRPGSTMNDQVAYFLKHAAPQRGDVLALDWEDAGVSGAQKDAWIKRCLAAAPGHRVLLYCNRDFWLTRDTTSYAGDGLWIADPEAAIGHPRVKTAARFHQYGIKGQDLDAALFGSASDLRAWAAGSPPPHVTPPPAPHKLTAATAVRLHVVAWTATHSAAEEAAYPQNRPEVYAVQTALVARHHLTEGHYIPGVFDTPTRAAYAAEQRAQHFTGADADGVPGKASLTALGKGRFTVKA